jgi:hypothetical protein
MLTVRRGGEPELSPPPNRQGKAKGGREQRFYEGAVMLAYAMHLLETENTREVRVHPDGMHGKQFDFPSWLRRHGFTRASSTGKTAYGGSYVDHAGRTIIVNPKSGQGDVVAKVGASVISCECKRGPRISTTQSSSGSIIKRSPGRKAPTSATMMISVRAAALPSPAKRRAISWPSRSKMTARPVSG